MTARNGAARSYWWGGIIGGRRMAVATVGGCVLAFGGGIAAQAEDGPAPAAEPAGQPPNARLVATPGGMVGAAYVDDWEAFLTNAVGARAEALASLPEYASPYDAEYDPVGERIAISSWRGLYLTDADGGNARLVPGTGAYSYFHWHPNIADRLIAGAPSGAVQIDLRADKAPVVKKLALVKASSYRYSPDGSKIGAVPSSGPASKVAWVYNANGSGAKKHSLRTDDYVHGWRFGPDSKSLIYGSDDGVLQQPLGAGPTKTLNADSGSVVGYDASGRLLFTTGSLHAYDFDLESAKVISTPNVILDEYSARPLAGLDLGSCDGVSPTITGTAGNDRLTGTAGNDIILGLGGDDVIDGGGGNDILCGGTGNDTLTGGAGDDRAFGDDGADRITGGVGNDRLGGGGGNDRVDGGDGDDRVSGGAGDDTALGGAGADDVRGGMGDDAIDAGAGDDKAFGEPGADVVRGGAGNDLVQGDYRWNEPESGADMLYGDDGDDWVTLAAGEDSAGFGGAGNDTVTLADTVDGGDGNDFLYLADVARGGNGDDRISRSVLTGYGEAGNDSLELWGWPCASRGGCTADGGDGDDLLKGDIAADILRGGAGNDVIKGDRGDDAIDGGTGMDQLHGGFGKDRITGGADADVIQGDADDDTIAGDAGDDQLIGGTGRDTLRGGDGNDTLSAFDDNDTLYGDKGDDRLTGGTGNDLLNGGVGTDRCDGAAGIDTGRACEVKVSIER